MRRSIDAAKALADPKRVRIVAALRKGELCVCELCDALHVRQSTLSTHLLLMLQAGLLSKRSEGKWAYYSLDPSFVPVVEAMFGCFSKELKQSPELKRDRKSLKARAAARKNGLCCVGFSKCES